MFPYRPHRMDESSHTHCGRWSGGLEGYGLMRGFSHNYLKYSAKMGFLGSRKSAFSVPRKAASGALPCGDEAVKMPGATQ